MGKCFASVNEDPLAICLWRLLEIIAKYSSSNKQINDWAVKKVCLIPVPEKVPLAVSDLSLSSFHTLCLPDISIWIFTY